MKPRTGKINYSTAKEPWFWCLYLDAIWQLMELNIGILDLGLDVDTEICCSWKKLFIPWNSFSPRAKRGLYIAFWETNKVSNYFYCGKAHILFGIQTTWGKMQLLPRNCRFYNTSKYYSMLHLKMESIEPGMVTHPGHPSTPEADTGGSEGQGQPYRLQVFNVNLNYIWPCLKRFFFFFGW